MTTPVNIRAARGFRLLATTMEFVADQLDDTPHAVPLRRQAVALRLYASELDGTRPHLTVVGRRRPRLEVVR